MYETEFKSIREMLALDGYSLAVESATDGAVEVRVVAEADACVECLVPKEIFETIIKKQLSDHGHETALRVIYPLDVADPPLVADSDAR